MNDRDREAFEAWARGPAGYVDNQLARYADGSYQDSTTRLHWSIWQAAWKALGWVDAGDYYSEEAADIAESKQRVVANDARRYRSIRAALLSGGPEWSKLAAMLNIAPDTPAGVDDAVDVTFNEDSL
jgi:hypothetical protein